jgi:hypothetical protein
LPAAAEVVRFGILQTLKVEILKNEHDCIISAARAGGRSQQPAALRDRWPAL